MRTTWRRPNASGDERNAKRDGPSRSSGARAETKPPKPPKAKRPPKAQKAPKPKPARSRDRRVGVAIALAAVFLGLAAIAAFAYRHFHKSTPPPVVVRTITLTIPEGLPALRPRKSPSRKACVAATRRRACAPCTSIPAEYGGKDAKDLEGFLFPDTFELKKHAGAADLVQLQLEDFKRRIAGVDMGYARSKNLTIYDVVTIASMIEHEVGLEASASWSPR